MDANLWFLLGVLVLTVPLYMITDIANTSDTKDFFKKVLRVVCCYSGVYSTSGSGADGEVTVKGNALKISLRNETVADCDRGVFVCGVGGWAWCVVVCVVPALRMLRTVQYMKSPVEIIP